jgi:hypothetical protein
MWLLRIANRGRWSDKSAEDSNHIDQAAKDVSLRKGEKRLSVFEVEDGADADWVATLLALTGRPGRLEKIDYLLIPPECFEALGLAIIPVPDPALIRDLSDRHREVTGMDQADLDKALATKILEDDRRQIIRISEGQLKDRMKNDLRYQPYRRDT